MNRCVRAIKDIKPGDEITVDYGFFDEFPPWWVGDAAIKSPTRSIAAPPTATEAKATESASPTSNVGAAKRKPGEISAHDQPARKIQPVVETQR